MPPLRGSVLACVDGSEWSIQAVSCLLSHPVDRVVLLHLSPSSARGYMECGRMALEAAAHRCRLLAPRLLPETRLEAGDARSRLFTLCRDEEIDVLTLAATARSGFPALSEAESFAGSVWAQCGCPVLLASARGVELLAGEERRLLASRVSLCRPIQRDLGRMLR